jgi:low affinity Fe/Cu permease
MDRIFTRIATLVATFVGQPLSFVAALLVVIIWGVTGPLFHYSDTWQLVINTGTTIVTFLIVFLIQNSQNRDAAAMQAKLDELLRAVGRARDQFIGIEHLSDKEIELIRSALEQHARDHPGRTSSVEDTVDQLLKRLEPGAPKLSS